MNRNIISMKGRSLLRINLQFGMIALLVGLVINLFYLTFDPSHYSARQFVYSFAFSLFITLSITNVVALFQTLGFGANSRFWVFVTAYYICNLVGMIIGTELTFIFVNLILRFRPLFRFHPEEYGSNAAIVLVVGTLILLYYFQKEGKRAALQAKENDLMQLRQLQSHAELQALQSRINPHFLYNVLNSIASLIHENPGQAEEMTIKLSKLFRYSISKGQENLHPLKDELEILRTYVDIEQVRFGDRMKIQIETTPELENAQVPRFLIQPLVENAIKHGLKNVPANALIRVKLSRLDNRLVIAVYDNGSPFPEEMEMGYGIQSTYDKLRLLYQNDYDLQLVNEPKHIMISLPFVIE
ncbi:MAG: histidine kinase [Chitinophagaceae bacterium]